MKTRQLGQLGLEVSSLGLGCMGMSMAYGKSDDNQSLKTLEHAINIGINFFDTSDLYGDGHNEELIAKAIRNVDRNKLVIATKCGFVRTGEYQYKIDGSANHIKNACDASLKRLGLDVIDLYYLHRADRNVPIEESMSGLADLVREGKIRHIGLSEVTSETLRRATKIFPVTALQSEYSLWHRKPEKNILNTCKELGVGFVPYSPLGRGFLTGKIQETSMLDASDFRRISPRFQGENLQHNLKLAEFVSAFAKRKSCTAAQLALAWVLAQGNDIVPIPGTRSIERLDENVGSLLVNLTSNELEEINEHLPMDAAAGEQYPKDLDFEV